MDLEEAVELATTGQAINFAIRIGARDIILEGDLANVIDKLWSKEEDNSDQYPNILSLSKLLPKKKSFNCSIYSLVVGFMILFLALCISFVLTLSFFQYYYYYIFIDLFFLSSMGKCTSSVDPYDHYYICRSFYIDINFQSLDLILYCTLSV